MSAIYKQDELLEITGCRNTTSLIAHLVEAGVKFNRTGPRGRVYTTHEAINASLGINQPKARASASKIEADPVITVD